MSVAYSIYKRLLIKFLRVRINIIKSLNKSDITDAQLTSIKILKKIMLSPDVEMFIAPSTGVHYVQCKEVFSKFSGDQVQIINGKYSYTVSLTLKQAEDLVHFFRNRLESKKKGIEKQITEKTNRSLNTILTEMEI